MNMFHFQNIITKFIYMKNIGIMKVVNIIILISRQYWIFWKTVNYYFMQDFIEIKSYQHWFTYTIAAYNR